MDPVVLEKAFELYPDVRIIVIAHLYGTPGKINEIRAIAKAHDALIVEDAAESLGAKYCSTQDNPDGRWIETGVLGDHNCISFIVRQSINCTFNDQKSLLRAISGQYLQGNSLFNDQLAA